MKSLKICFVTPYSPKIVGGVGTFILEMCAFLKDKRIETLIITGYVEDGLDINENIFELKVGRIKYVSGLLYGLRTMFMIFKLRKKIDILHIQTPNYLNCFSLLAGKILRIPVITTFHGKFAYSKNIVKRGFQVLGEKMSYKLSNEVTYVSKDTKKYYKHPKGQIILNGVNTQVFSKDLKKRSEMRDKHGIKDEIVFLYVGRITFTKGINELIKATSVIKNSTNDIKILIVGPIIHNEMQNYHNKIRDAGIDNYVINFGEQMNVHDFYCASDVLLLPSYSEGLPFIILEAMSSGLPVIATKVGEIPNIINNYENGLILEPRNVDDLVEKMMWCIHNKEKLPIIGENGHKTIIEKYTIENMAEKYLNLYFDLLQVEHCS